MSNAEMLLIVACYFVIFGERREKRFGYIILVFGVICLIGEAVGGAR